MEIVLLNRDDGSSEVPESTFFQEPIVSAVVLSMFRVRLKFNLGFILAGTSFCFFESACLYMKCRNLSTVVRIMGKATARELMASFRIFA